MVRSCGRNRQARKELTRRLQSENPVFGGGQSTRRHDGVITASSCAITLRYLVLNVFMELDTPSFTPVEPVDSTV
jgi:hypothetical protein